MTPVLFKTEETTSSNAWLTNKNKEGELPEGSMVVTAFQSGGRGQAGNTWESEAGKNLLCSAIFYPEFLPPSLQFHVSRVAALACFTLLSEYTQDIRLKWPNDIYYKDKKLGGILIENSLVGNVYGNCILGIGINLNQDRFMSDAPNPVSLIQIIHKTTPIGDFAIALQKHLMQWYAMLKSGNINHIEECYFKALYRNKGAWLFSENGNVFKASIVEVEPSGRLVLQTSEDRRKYWFKEVEFVI